MRKSERKCSKQKRLMTPQIQSQLLGLALALSTAIGCVAYERLVQNFSIFIIFLLSSMFYVPALCYVLITQPTSVSSDLYTVWNNKPLMWASLIYYISWITTPLWFIITKKQGVLVGSIYEVKYIVILAALYVMFGNKALTYDLTTGFIFALMSLYFISKT